MPLWLVRSSGRTNVAIDRRSGSSIAFSLPLPQVEPYVPLRGGEWVRILEATGSIAITRASSGTYSASKPPSSYPIPTPYYSPVRPREDIPDV